MWPKLIRGPSRSVFSWIRVSARKRTSVLVELVRYPSTLKIEHNSSAFQSIYVTILATLPLVSDPSYRGEACQHLDLDLVGLEVKGH